MTEAMPNTAPKAPWNMALFLRGISGTMITMTPENMPADPRPAIARPIINAIEFGAAPHIAEPASKMKRQMKKVLIDGQPPTVCLLSGWW